MMGGLRNRLSLAALIAVSSVGMAATVAQPAPVTRSAARYNHQRGLHHGGTMPSGFTWGYHRPGMTMEQQQRASRKKRNIKHHRAASRG